MRSSSSCDDFFPCGSCPRSVGRKSPRREFRTFAFPVASAVWRAPAPRRARRSPAPRGESRLLRRIRPVAREEARAPSRGEFLDRGEVRPLPRRNIFDARRGRPLLRRDFFARGKASTLPRRDILARRDGGSLPRRHFFARGRASAPPRRPWLRFARPRDAGDRALARVHDEREVRGRGAIAPSKVHAVHLDGARQSVDGGAATTDFPRRRPMRRPEPTTRTDP